MIEGAVFDMDGLMFDTERLSMDAWSAALAEFGYTYTDELGKSIRGRNDRDIHAVLSKTYGEDTPCLEIHQRTWDKMEHRLATEGVPEKPGLHELLEWLKQKGIPCALATSSHRAKAERRCRASGVWEYFSTVICGDMITHSKPAPDIFLKAAEGIGARPENCLVFEDSFNGVRAGHAGGLITIMVPDLDQPTPEICELYTARANSLLEVRDRLEKGEWQ